MALVMARNYVKQTNASVANLKVPVTAGASAVQPVNIRLCKGKSLVSVQQCLYTAAKCLTWVRPILLTNLTRLAKMFTENPGS